MNSIKNIEIKNFKSIRHVKIEDCRRINVFVGYPNTGKSNILEAIGLFSSIRLIGDNFKFNDICRVKRFSELFYNKDYRSATNITLNNQLLLELIISQSNNLEVRVHRQNVRINDVLTKAQIYSSTINSDFEYRDNTGINEKLYREVMEPIRKYEFISSLGLNKKSPLSLAIPFGNNLLEVLHSNSALRKEVAELFNEYNQKMVLDDEEIIFLKYLGDGTGVSIPYHLVADTLRRLIFYKAAVMSNSESILIFEEPESHMFPPYISKFTSDMWYYKGNQFFLSTHSPFVVNDFLENMKEDLAIYFVDYKKDTGETTIKRLTEEQIHETYQYGIDIFFNLESITK